MSPLSSGICRIGFAPIVRGDGQDLLHNFERSSDVQYVTTACARDFPSLKAVTP